MLLINWKLWNLPSVILFHQAAKSNLSFPMEQDLPSDFNQNYVQNGLKTKIIWTKLFDVK